MVSVELCDGLDVWSLATACTSTGELEERLRELCVLDIAESYADAVRVTLRCLCIRLSAYYGSSPVFSDCNIRMVS